MTLSLAKRNEITHKCVFLLTQSIIKLPVHVEIADGKVDSVWIIDEDSVIERFHSVGVMTPETKF